MSRRPTYRELFDLVGQQAKHIGLLANRVKELEERLLKYEHPKNSRNSSIPPSQDVGRPKPDQSLRKPSGKKPGGQLGRKGRTLEMSPNPDYVVKLQPGYCTSCGLPLKNKLAVKQKSRQVIDIPPIQAVCTEYQSYSKQCSCGCTTVAGFPKGASAPVS